MAALKLDNKTFESLCAQGFDPMMPDEEGNTFLHLLALGQVRAAEYDFVKFSVCKHKLRLSRNRNNKTPLSIIKQFSGQPVNLKGEPNFKRKLWEWFEMKLQEDPCLMDSSEVNTPAQVLIQNGDLEGLKELLSKETQAI